MNVFAQIRKVDESKRLVFGRAAEEVVDQSGEIMDYASTKPHFQKWSAEVQADTDGKSLGNLRAMHGKVAAGKLTDISFDDSAKAIDVVAKVVDDAEWKKVLEGVYTGFSIGGAYVGEKKVEKINGQEVRRYTAKPNELSLVDRPCIPTAKFFEVQKADGSKSEVAFKEPDTAAQAAAAASAPVEKQEADDANTINGTPEQVEQLCKLMSSGGLSLADVLGQVEKAVAERKDVNPKSGASEYGDVKFADATNKKYPIDTEEHIRAAWNYINKEKNAGKYSAKDVAAIKARIVSAWKSKIDKDGPPSASEKAEAGGELAKLEFTPDLRKSLYGGLCAVLDSLMYLRQSAAYEAFQEGDNSPLPSRVDAVIALCAEVLQEAVAEAVSEVKAGTEAGETGATGGEPGEQVELAERIGVLRKACADPLAVLGLAKVASHPVEKAEAVTSEALAKLVADAVAPLHKALDASAARIEQLERQPAPAKVSLRAVTKAADTVIEHHQQPGKIEPVRDGLGKVNESATLIKQAHQQGGRPFLRVGG